jgi:HlyD family secretion protein
VTFRVDAYAEKTFVGSVRQVRLQPVVAQNVVTYTTIIDVPNQNLELKPGMTANVQIEITRCEDVLRVPAAALRFRPTRDIFEALGLPLPAELQPRSRGTGADSPSASGSGRLPAAGERGGGDRAIDETAAGTSMADRDATTVDALFGPLTFDEMPGRVWVYAVDPATKAKSLKAVAVRTRISDGSNVELIVAGGLAEGSEVVTGVDIGQASSRPSANPLMPGRSPMMGGGGHGGGPH